LRSDVNAALADGNISYTPNSEFEGTDTLSFSATSTDDFGVSTSTAASQTATITVNGVSVPVTASGIPGDIVFVQPMAALGAGPTALGQAYISAANQVTVPFVAFAAAGAIATQNYLVTVIKLGQLTGVDS